MSIIVYIVITVWLLKAVIDVFVGLIQVAIGLTGGILGCLCFAALFLIEGIEMICRVAFSSTKR